MAQLKSIKRLTLPFVPPNLKIGREIDRGAWGAVHEGELGGQPVAVKRVHELLKEPGNGDTAVESFFKECDRLRELDHPYVVSEYLRSCSYSRVVAMSSSLHVANWQIT